MIAKLANKLAFNATRLDIFFINARATLEAVPGEDVLTKARRLYSVWKLSEPEARIIHQMRLMKLVRNGVQPVAWNRNKDPDIIRS